MGIVFGFLYENLIENGNYKKLFFIPCIKFRTLPEATHIKMIKTINLRKVYTSFSVETVALDNINLEIQAGEFLAITGPSGCGKSTLLNILALLDDATSGDVFFFGRSVANMSDREKSELRKRYLGFVFQSFNLIEEISIYENIELPLTYLRIPKNDRKIRVLQVMEQLQIAHKQHFYPQQLSGGQQQRVAIARAIVTNPKILVADEPTGNLDSAKGREVMDIFSRLNELGTTIILVTHSSRNADFAQRVLHLFDGQIVTENITRML